MANNEEQNFARETSCLKPRGETRQGAGGRYLDGRKCHTWSSGVGSRTMPWRAGHLDAIYEVKTGKLLSACLSVCIDTYLYIVYVYGIRL